MTRKRMRIGDLLTFKAATRDSYRKATRVITGFDNTGRPLVRYAGFDNTGRPLVRYAGWSDFIVQPREIIEVKRP
jgi:hypothetical protein